MTMTTDNKKGIYPDAVFEPMDVIPEALILKVGTPGGEIEGDAPVVRVPYVLELPAVDFVPEGEAATPSDPVFDELLVSTQKLMLISKLSREASMHTVAADLLATSMGKAMIRKANNAFINGTTPAGLDTVAGAPITGALGDNLDVIVDAMTGIEVAGGQATDIITDPLTWSTIRKMKAATGSNAPLIGNPAELNAPVLFGCAVHVSPDVSAGTLLVVDSSNVITVPGKLELTLSGDAYFTADTIARRLVWRIGWGVVDAERIAKVSVTPAA